MVDEQTS